jgi:hypothetical protein
MRAGVPCLQATGTLICPTIFLPIVRVTQSVFCVRFEGMLFGGIVVAFIQMWLCAIWGRNNGLTPQLLPLPPPPPPPPPRASRGPTAAESDRRHASSSSGAVGRFISLTSEVTK